MKKVLINLFLTITFMITALCLNAQLVINTVQVPQATGSNVSICDDVTLSLNGADLEGNDCEFTTEFSQVQSGTNTLTVRSDLSPLVNTSTLDLVRVAIAMDEGFDSYALAMASDIDNDQVITTDDLILMSKLILGIETEIPVKVRIGPIEYATDPFTGLDLLSDHSTMTFDSSEVQDGETTEIILISVGSL